MPLENIVETDVLIIGGGVAGCFAAIKAKGTGLNVTLVDKAYAGKSGASGAAPGWWGIFNSEWGHDWDACMNEANKGNDYVNNHEWNEIILKDSWQTYEELVAWGVEFPIEIGKRRDWFTKEVERGRERFVRRPIPPYAQIPLRRRKYSPFIRKQAEKIGVQVVDRIMVTDLLKRNGEIVGAIGFALDSGNIYIFKAKATVVSGGGNSFKPSGGFDIDCITGDADAMAYRAGAELTGKEFPDHHFGLANYPAWHCCGGGIIVPFPYHTDAEGNVLVPFAPQAFAIHAGRGPIYWNLDAATPEDIKAIQIYSWKSGVDQEYERIGLDPSRGGKYQLKGGSGAGYMHNNTTGLWPINTKCATSLPGLYAAGDCCSTRFGFHWGLSTAAVTGTRAGQGAAEYALQTKKHTVNGKELERLKQVLYAPAERKGGFSPRWVTQLLQNTMMPYFIMQIKHEKRLQAALTMIEFLRDQLVPKLVASDPHELRLAHETKNMVLNAEIILSSSLFRTESRGVHFREDYPRKDDPAWLAWIKLKQDGGRMKLMKEPMPKAWWPDLSIPYEKRYPGEVMVQ